MSTLIQLLCKPKNYKKVNFIVKQTKINQDESANIPDEVFEKGHNAIKDWLIAEYKIDNALDHAETETRIELIYKK